MNKDVQLIWESYQLRESTAESRLQSEPTPEHLHAHAVRDLAFVDSPLYRDVSSSSSRPMNIDNPSESRLRDHVQRVLQASPESRKQVFDILTKTLANDKLHFILSPDEARWVMGDTDQAPDLTSSRDRINPEEAQKRDAERQANRKAEAGRFEPKRPLPPPPSL